MEFDEFDQLLSDERVTDEEWKAFAVILEINNIEKKGPDEKRLVINRKFRRFYGHTIVNGVRVILRNDFSTDYKDSILKEVCSYLGIADIISLDASVLEIEDSIFKCIGKDRVFNKNSYDIYVKDILEAADSKVSLKKKLVSGALGGVGGVFGKTFGALGVCLSMVNEFCFETNWEKVFATIMLAHTIRKNLLIKDLFDK